MSEKELLKALEDDARRECTAMIESARREADAIITEATEKMEKVKKEKFEQAKASMQSDRTRRLTNARLYAREVMLKERQLAIAKIFDEVGNRLKELRKDEDYPEILKRLCKEAMDGWHDSMKDEKALIMVSKQDISYLPPHPPPLSPSQRGTGGGCGGLSNTSGCEIVSDETGDMLPGVVIMSRDKRFKIINTLDSRLKKKKTEIVSMIDRALLSAE